jgi:hypothetical protein
VSVASVGVFDADPAVVSRAGVLSAAAVIEGPDKRFHASADAMSTEPVTTTARVHDGK